MKVKVQSPAKTRLTVKNTKSLLLGLGSINYYDIFWPLLNWWKAGDSLNVKRTVGGNISGQAAIDAGYISLATGELSTSAPAGVTGIEKLIYVNDGAQTAGGVKYDMGGEPMTIKWNGTCTEVKLTYSIPITVDYTNKTATFTIPASADPIYVQFNGITANDPIRSVNVYQTRYASNVAAGEIYNPDWINEVKQFKTLRFMDLQLTNYFSSDTFHVVNYSDTPTEAYDNWVGVGKRGFPITAIAKLGNVTGCDLHVCIPHTASDAWVTAAATALRDGVTDPNVRVHFELSNEVWNYGFAQTSDYNTLGAGKPYSTGDVNSDGRAYYGHRLVQCLALVRAVYGTSNRDRWRGGIGLFASNTSTTDAIMVGVNYGLSQASLTLPDVLDLGWITNYFAGVVYSDGVQAITKGSPTVLDLGSHSYQTGDVIRVGLRSDIGDQNFQNKTYTVTKIDNAKISIPVDSTSFSVFSSDWSMYVASNKIFALFETSITKFNTDPTNFPKRTTYFSQVFRDRLISNANNELAGVTNSLADLVAIIKPHKTKCDALGLELRAYEGGSHFVGLGGLTGYGGNNPVGDLFTEFLVGCAHSAEMGVVYQEMFNQMFAGGLKYPAKFVERGSPGRYGSWGAMRWGICAKSSTVDNNPVWLKTKAANNGTITLS